MILTDPLGSKGLHGSIQHLERHTRDRELPDRSDIVSLGPHLKRRLDTVTDLGDPDILHRPLGPGDIDPMSRREDQQPTGVDLAPALGDITDDRPVFLQHLPKRLPRRVRYPLEHHVERTLGRPDRSHTMMNPTGSEPTLDDLEPPSPTADKAFLFVQPDVVVQDLAVTFGGVVVPKDLHGADDLDPRVIGRDEDDGESFMLVRVGWVGQADEDMDRVPGVSRARDPLREDERRRVKHWVWVDFTTPGRGDLPISSRSRRPCHPSSRSSWPD